MERFPLVPSDLAKPEFRLRGVRSLMRAATLLAKTAYAPHKNAAKLAEQIYPSDALVKNIITRAASSPASTTGWGSQFTTSVVGEFIESLAPISAGASLMQAAPYVPLDSANRVLFPRVATAISGAPSWVAEGTPAPAKTPVLDTVTLGPAKKLVILTALSREMSEHTAAEAIIGALLREKAAFDLDVSLFSTTAADDARPAGLLNGVAGLTPSVATDQGVAMAADLALLAAAIAPTTGSLAYVANPKQANAIKLVKGAMWTNDVPVWPTIGVAPETVIAIDTMAFVSGFESEPELTSSREALFHEESVTPLAIGSSGAPATVAAPTRSLFQTDCVALKLTLRCAWAWRVPGAVAWMSAVNW